MCNYKIQLVNKYTGDVLDDFVEEETFETLEEARNTAMEWNNAASIGQEVLYLSNPGDYDAEEKIYEDYEYEETEM